MSYQFVPGEAYLNPPQVFGATVPPHISCNVYTERSSFMQQARAPAKVGIPSPPMSLEDAFIWHFLRNYRNMNAVGLLELWNLYIHTELRGPYLIATQSRAPNLIERFRGIYQAEYLRIWGFTPVEEKDDNPHELVLWLLDEACRRRTQKYPCKIQNRPGFMRYRWTWYHEVEEDTKRFPNMQLKAKKSDAWSWVPHAAADGIAIGPMNWA